VNLKRETKITKIHSGGDDKMIALGCDHGGYEMKNAVAEYLKEKGYEILDCKVVNDDSDDYPDVAYDVCSKVLKGEAKCAFLFCGTGIGISIAANKIKGIRAALVYDTESARLSKEHNDANVLCMGGRTMDLSLVKNMLDAYFGATFLGERHKVRLDKISKLESL